MSSNHNITVVVAMSGGVDSSVAALLLKQQGYNVVGMFMKNWEEGTSSNCPSAEEYDDVIRVCNKIDIPYYSVNFVKEYWDGVFESFLKEYEAGYTPNPDILCNREIKFKALLEKAMNYGADYLATGHYVRRAMVEGKYHLLKGLDPLKDQSYFLYAINGEVLPKILFPIGELHKTEVRKIAEEYGLSTAKKKDSTGICFIGERNFKDFLSQYVKKKSGEFQTLNGRIVGKHDGVAFYTIGQRKGLAIGGEGDAWFVVDKDIEKNIVFIEQGMRHPALYADELTATELNWIQPENSLKLPFRCKAKIRYRQPDQDCTIVKIEKDKVFVSFDIPQRAITIRQSIVFYDNEICLGGGVIDQRGQTYFEKGLELPNIVSL